MSSQSVRPGTPPAINPAMASVVETPATAAQVLTRSPEHQIDASSAIYKGAASCSSCSTAGWTPLTDLKTWQPPNELEGTQSSSSAQSHVPSVGNNDGDNELALEQLQVYGEDLPSFSEEAVPSQGGNAQEDSNVGKSDENVAAESLSDGEDADSGEVSDGTQEARGSDSQSASDVEGDDSGEESNNDVKANRSDKTFGSEAETLEAEEADSENQARPTSPVSKDKKTEAPNSAVEREEASDPMDIEFSDSASSSSSIPSSSSSSSSSSPLVARGIDLWLQNWRGKHGYASPSSSNLSSSATSSTSTSSSSEPQANPKDCVEQEASSSASSSSASLNSPTTSLKTDPQAKSKDGVEQEASGVPILATSLSSPATQQKPSKMRDCFSSLRSACASAVNYPTKYWSKPQKIETISAKPDATSSISQRTYWPSLSLPESMKAKLSVSSRSNAVTATAASSKESVDSTKERKKLTCHRNDVIMMTTALVVLGFVANHFVKR